MKMKSRKIKLNTLEVESFVTSNVSNFNKTIIGGELGDQASGFKYCTLVLSCIEVSNVYKMCHRVYGLQIA